MGYNIRENNPNWNGGYPKCIICKKILTHRSQNAICRPCRKNIKKIKETCICGNHKSKVSKICKKCDSKTRSKLMKGKNNPMFGKKGKLAGNYKDGRCLKEYKCKICNKNRIHWMTYLYQGARCDSCSRKAELNGNWKNGISKLPYPFEFNNELKELIRKRDNYNCQLCGRQQIKEIQERNRKLAIHHIDYNKKNLQNNNLISLCCKCNSKVNNNRNYFKKYFRRIIK